MKKNIFVKYEDKWVAVKKSSNKVLKAASSLEKLESELKDVTDKDLILTRVLPFDYVFAP